MRLNDLNLENNNLMKNCMQKVWEDWVEKKEINVFLGVDLFLTRRKKCLYPIEFTPQHLALSITQFVHFLKEIILF